MNNSKRRHKITSLILTLVNIQVMNYVNCIHETGSSVDVGEMFNLDAARLVEQMKPFHDIHPDAYSDPVSKCV